MKRFQFKTDTRMKYYNRDKYWVMGDYVRDKVISAGSLDVALNEFADHINESYGVDVSKSALKNKSAMYDKNDEQIGYVITGSMLFCDETRGGYSKQFIELWVQIDELSSPFGSK